MPRVVALTAAAITVLGLSAGVAAAGAAPSGSAPRLVLHGTGGLHPAIHLPRNGWIYKPRTARYALALTDITSGQSFSTAQACASACDNSSAAHWVTDEIIATGAGSDTDTAPLGLYSSAAPAYPHLSAFEDLWNAED
jgi:hypothetical protein